MKCGLHAVGYSFQAADNKVSFKEKRKKIQLLETEEELQHKK